ncbi:MAG: type IV toxin-antitoxin system AbiEi family antitoxin domain-containing protein, partial [Actinomycetota bacterium]|nr:type IV toxin-antitoxin system AbiEi family antitoxin domain-containing protein [Actinomycetota bacterium]
MASLHPDVACGQLAARQHGCISLGQALDRGLSPYAIRRRVASKEWVRVLPRVYLLVPAPATWKQRLMAAVLWLGPGAAISGASAAALWGFPGFRAGPVEVSHPGNRPSRDGVRVHRRIQPLNAEIRIVDALSTTAPARTLADVAGRIPAADLDAAVHHCLYEKLTTLASIRAVSDRHRGRGHPGAAALRNAIAAYGNNAPASGSPLEARVLRRLIGA